MPKEESKKQRFIAHIFTLLHINSHNESFVSEDIDEPTFLLKVSAIYMYIYVYIHTYIYISTHTVNLKIIRAHTHTRNTSLIAIYPDVQLPDVA